MDMGLSDFQEGPLELRLWLNDPETFQPVCSARLDVHYIGKGDDQTMVLLHDWKSGLAMYKYCPPARSNWQMKVAAVIAAEEYGASWVRVELNRMEHQNPHVDSFDYDPDRLRKARADVFEALAGIHPGASRRPGDCCGFCPCKAHCPESAAMSMLPLPMAGTQAMVGRSKKELIAAKVATMTPEALAYVWRRSSIITNTVEAIKSRLKRLPAEELAKVGVRLGDGIGRDSIPGECTRDAIKHFVKMGIPEERAWQLLKVDLTAIAKEMETMKGIGEDAAKELVKREMSDKGWLKKTVGEPILREIK
jgi:hypothetical protein